jgi:hypothetical protein
MTETQLRKTPLPEFDVEQEVDLGRYWRAIATRWWLVVAGLVGGVVIGLLFSLGGNTFFKAEAITYLGSPLAPGGGGQLPNFATNPRIVDQLLRSEAVMREVGAKSGLRVSQLRGNIGTRSLQGNLPRAGQAQLYGISVKGRQARKIAIAANALANEVIARVSGYVQVKIQQLKEHLAFDQRELGEVIARLELTRRQQRAVLRDAKLSSADKLIAVANFNSALTFLESRRANLEQDRFAIRQLLKLAEDVERARILTRATPVTSSARSRRNSLLIGGLIGLILGVLAAILWEPVAQRFAGRPAQ